MLNNWAKNLYLSFKSDYTNNWFFFVKSLFCGFVFLRRKEWRHDWAKEDWQQWTEEKRLDSGRASGRDLNRFQQLQVLYSIGRQAWYRPNRHTSNTQQAGQDRYEAREKGSQNGKTCRLAFRNLGGFNLKRYSQNSNVYFT